MELNPNRSKSPYPDYYLNVGEDIWIPYAHVYYATFTCDGTVVEVTTTDLDNAPFEVISKYTLNLVKPYVLPYRKRDEN